MKIINNTTLDQIEEAAKHAKKVLYGFNTCWWHLDITPYRKGSLPCGPRGEMLLESNDPLGFIKAAKENEEHYGKQGIKAFVAAYHGNLIAPNGNPTSFENWTKYNDLLEEAQIDNSFFEGGVDG